jgi:hypothetical protein
LHVLTFRDISEKILEELPEHLIVPSLEPPIFAVWTVEIETTDGPTLSATFAKAFSSDFTEAISCVSAKTP